MFSCYFERTVFIYSNIALYFLTTKLLLMDEPSMGLAPKLVEQSFEIIQRVNETGVSVLMVEQNANMALSIADHGYVLATGRVVLHGPASELAEDDELKKAYLGR